MQISILKQGTIFSCKVGKKHTLVPVSLMLHIKIWLRGHIQPSSDNAHPDHLLPIVFVFPITEDKKMMRNIFFQKFSFLSLSPLSLSLSLPPRKIYHNINITDQVLSFLVKEEHLFNDSCASIEFLYILNKKFKNSFITKYFHNLVTF